MIYFFFKTIQSLKRNGIKKTVKKIKLFLRFFSLLKSETKLNKFEKLSQKKTTFSKKIKISIITPIFNTPKKYLKKMINSVLSQTYYNWELCLADGSDNDHKYIKNVCLDYSQKDNRIKYKKIEKNFGISGNSNIAIEMSSGEYLGILDHDDLLHPSALYEVMKVICCEDADFIYSDEATFINDNFINLKHHKPDYAIDTLCSGNYICHFSVFSRKLIDRAGTFRSDFDGSQDHDLILRYTDIASKIIHIPKLLYFWRSHKNSVAFDINNKNYAITAGKNAVKEYLEKHEMSVIVENAIENSGSYRVIYKLKERPIVSIIIPNKNQALLLKKCISSIIEKTTYSDYEIIIVENNSTEDDTFNYYKEIEQRSNITVVYWEEDGFNYSKLNNFGVQYAKGTQLVFLNNDIEIITPNWIEEMLMYNQRSDVGAVGIKLYYPDDTVQHAGVILGLGGVASHIFIGESRNEIGYMGRLKITQNMSAVTAACMMVKKRVFDEIGYFSPEFYASYSDVDLCLKIRKAGYLIVWTPYAEAYHHESKTRGYNKTSEKKHELAKESALLETKWLKELALGDPYYNCNFSLKKADYSLK